MRKLKARLKQPSSVVGIAILGIVWLVGVDNLESILKALLPVIERTDKLIGTALGVAAIWFNEDKTEK